MTPLIAAGVALIMAPMLTLATFAAAFAASSADTGPALERPR